VFEDVVNAFLSLQPCQFKCLTNHNYLLGNYMKSKIRERGGIGKLGARLLSKISAKEKEVFTVKEAEEELGMKGGNLRKLLFSLNRNGWVERIERGKYLILPLEAGAKPDYGTHPYIIARKLANPYYIGFASALNYYGITEQVGRTIYTATLKSKLPLAFHSENYRFVCLSKKRFFAATPISRFKSAATRLRSPDKNFSIAEMVFLYSSKLIIPAQTPGQRLRW